LRFYFLRSSLFFAAVGYCDTASGICGKARRERCAACQPVTIETLVLPKVSDLKKLKMTLAERFDLWAQQHEQRGVVLGIVRGEAKLQQRRLSRCFGPLPATQEARLA